MNAVRHRVRRANWSAVVDKIAGAVGFLMCIAILAYCWYR